MMREEQQKRAHRLKLIKFYQIYYYYLNSFILLWCNKIFKKYNKLKYILLILYN